MIIEQDNHDGLESLTHCKLRRDENRKNTRTLRKHLQFDNTHNTIQKHCKYRIAPNPVNRRTQQKFPGESKK